MIEQADLRSRLRVRKKAPTEVPSRAGATTTISLREEELIGMSTVPYFGENGNRCPRGHKNCPCFIEGSSMTYNLVISDVRRVFGWSFRMHRYAPSQTWKEVVNRLTSWRHKKGL